MKVNFILGTRANTDILSPMAQAVEYTRAQLMARGIFFYWEILGGYSDPKNASLIMTHCIQSESPYLILIDRDILFNPDRVLKLYQRLEEGYDFISGLYCLRNGMRLAGVPYNEPYIIDGNVQEFKYITSGFTGYSRKMLLAIKEKMNLQLCNQGEQDDYYPFAEEKSHANAIFGWDWDFCLKARETGFKSYVDTSIQVGHMGEKIYTIQDYMDYQDDALQASPLDEADYEILKQDFSDFFNIREEDIEHHVREYNNTSFSNLEWLDKKGKDYYKDNIPFLCGLIGFTTKKDTIETRYKPLDYLKGLNIFDLGCGIGTLAFRLSKKNFVMGYDINEKGIDFCNFRQGKLQSNTKFVKEMPQYLKDFNVVTCTDVLEHIEDLGTFLKDLGNKMKTGACLYHYDAFKDVDTFMHYNHEKHIDEYLKDAGFMPINKLWAVKT